MEIETKNSEKVTLKIDAGLKPWTGRKGQNGSIVVSITEGIEWLCNLLSHCNQLVINTAITTQQWLDRF